jgi:peptidyl-dipeptidase Dcp
MAFTEVFDIDKYHPEVMTYEVTDEKKDLVVFMPISFLEKENETCMDDFV